jgi:hypothetical protein
MDNDDNKICDFYYEILGPNPTRCLEELFEFAPCGAVKESVCRE